MRYFWALLAYVVAIVVTSASCGSSKGTGATHSSGNGGSMSSATGGNTSGTNNGGGGSSGVFMTTGAGGDSGAPDGAPCAAYKSCAQQGKNCDMIGDGCGNIIDCGMCTNPGESCNGNQMNPNVCSKPNCTPSTCTSLGYDCGMASDGCNGTLSCGTCPMSMPVCGANNMPNKCGVGTCMPATCASLGNLNCGMTGDGCGGTLNCGTCPANQVCGGGANPMPNVCGSVMCTPKTCTDQGFNCGMATDGCGNVINCGASCPMGQICGANMPNVCGSTNVCTGLCLKQVMCPGMGTTSVSGTVYAPNGTDPVPNTLVYVPNGNVGAPTWGVQPFVDGVNPPHCDCGSDVTGNPLVSAVTDYKGQFTINNMPVGTNIPLVIQNGRWRRKFTIANVAMCANTPLPTSGPGQIRFPKVEHESDPADNIPKMGFVTGSVDALECVLRKIGIADSQFSDPGGIGRVQFYLGDNFAGGAQYSATTPDESLLWGNQNTINGYDMAFFACKGAEYDRTTAAQQTVINYANAGGRIFTTHYGYVWLFDDPPFSTTATWNVDQIPFFTSDPQTGFIVTNTQGPPAPVTPFAKGDLLAHWLQYIGASTTLGQMTIQTLRDDFTAVAPPPTAQLWIYLNDPAYPPFKPMHYTFDTPVGVAPANQCGRVLYDDFHVEDAFTTGLTFPTECTVPGMTPQEKMLEFMIFDLGSCVAPPKCLPKTCAQQNTQCGPVGDGCGNIIMCGNCPSGKACVGGMCVGTNCTPKDCTSQGYMCGMQGDGCGNVINCGNCPSGQTCGVGGTGKCGNGSCVPMTCPAGYMCGNYGDGCGNVLNCGMCPPGEICGGGGVPGQCWKPPCMPKTCAQQGFNCGNATDGCGNTINCGTCTGTCTCGGGGMANVCGGCAG
jgi:hypothetical protein